MTHQGIHLDLKKGWNVPMLLFGAGEGLRKICSPNWWSLPTNIKTKLSVSPSSSVVQSRLPMQQTWVRSLVRKDPHAAEQLSLDTTTVQSACLRPVLRNKRSQHNGKLEHCNQRTAPLSATKEGLRRNEDPTRTRNTIIFKIINQTMSFPLLSVHASMVLLMACSLFWNIFPWKFSPDEFFFFFTWWILNLNDPVQRWPLYHFHNLLG